MNKKLISVIIPVYNAEKYLQQCINSILNQTYKNLEIIIIDDGSTDQSGYIADHYTLEDSRVTVFHQTNKGQACARNEGLDQAHGDYIGFVDSDDFVFPEMYEMLLQIAEENNGDIVICKTIDISDRNWPKVNSSSQFKIYESSDLLQRIYDVPQIYNTAPCNKLYKSGLFDRVRFPELRMYEDEGIVVPLLLNSNRVIVTDKVLYCYYLSPNSVMRKRISPKVLDIIPLYEERMRMFKKNKYESLYLKSEAWLYYHLTTILYRLKYQQCDDYIEIESCVNEALLSITDIRNNPHYSGIIQRRCELMKKHPQLLHFVDTIKECIKKVIRAF